MCTIISQNAYVQWYTDIPCRAMQDSRVSLYSGINQITLDALCVVWVVLIDSALVGRVYVYPCQSLLTRGACTPGHTTWAGQYRSVRAPDTSARITSCHWWRNPRCLSKRCPHTPHFMVVCQHFKY